MGKITKTSNTYGSKIEDFKVQEGPHRPRTGKSSNGAAQRPGA